MDIIHDRFRFKPAQLLFIGFLLLIVIGALALQLPIMSENGQKTSFINSLFTATSAVCVTGLVVVDTSTHWSTLGEVVILALIQIGGLGFMTLAVLFSIAVGRKIGLKERLIVQESLNQDSFQGIVKFTIQIILVTIVIELIGSIFLAIQFIPDFGIGKGIYYSIFHSVSAFNNAGFDLMGHYNGKFSSLTSYVDNKLVSLTVSLLVISGGLGFSVYKDLLNFRVRKLSTHTKLALIISGILLVFGTVFFLAAEYNNPMTLKNLGFMDKLNAAFFHSSVTRTAGYNSVSIKGLTDASKFVTVILMFIGGSPGSTAGGIKTVTLGVLILSMLATVRGKNNTEVFRRVLNRSVINKALSITMISIGVVISVVISLTLIENAGFMDILFETVSAFGTVGLTTGITSGLSVLGKLIIATTMLFGRLGPLTMALVFMNRESKNASKIKYPEDRVMVG